MRNVVALLGILLLAPAAVAGQTPQAAAPVAAPGEWTGPRTPDGQPDVQGTWYAPLSGSFSLVNPFPGGQRFNFIADGRPLPKNPSRIVDPPDGLVPYQPWAAAKHKDLEDHAEDPKKPEHIDSQTRCLPQGVGRGFYTTSARIAQFPGYVLIAFDQYQYFRVVRLGGPHVAPNIKLWMGDPVGHWEGNTLVIDVTSLNGKSRLTQTGDFYSENAHIVERLTFADRNVATYRATFEDSAVYTRTWTIAVAMKRVPSEEFWEYGCHEGNHTDSWAISTPNDTEKTGK